MPLLKADQGSDAWKSHRVGRITASVAAGALGLHPHMSRQEAWRSVLGIQKDKGNDATRWGIQFEPAARAAYEVETGNFVTETGLWVHPKYDWMAASPDGLIGTDGGVEIKCSGKIPPMVPIYHRIQCLVQMLCTERSWIDYYVFVVRGTDHNGNPVAETFRKRVYLAGEAWLIRKLEEFYQTYVVPSVEPPRKARKKKTK